MVEDGRDRANERECIEPDDDWVKAEMVESEGEYRWLGASGGWQEVLEDHIIVEQEEVDHAIIHYVCMRDRERVREGKVHLHVMISGTVKNRAASHIHF